MSRPSSYIPTTTAATTRAADIVKIDGTAFSDFYHNDEFTILSLVRRLTSETGYSYTISDGSANNRIQVWDGGPQRNSQVRDDNIVQSSLSVGSSLFGNCVLAIAQDDFAFQDQGAALQTGSSVTIPLGLHTINIASYYNGTSQVNGTMPLLVYFPKRLPDATLQQLSALEV
jgi:hypothetical protein